jgi:hypothetical protein
MPFDTTRLPDRFWAKVNREGPIPTHAPHLGPCWIWTGSTVKRGYGHYRTGGKKDGGPRRMSFVHRVAYQALVGRIGDGLEVDHLCRVVACCNPAHLEPVTKRENVVRGAAPVVTTARHAAVMRCPKGHPYDAANTIIEHRQGYPCRTCRQCKNARRNRNRIAA